MEAVDHAMILGMRFNVNCPGNAELVQRKFDCKLISVLNGKMKVMFAILKNALTANRRFVTIIRTSAFLSGFQKMFQGFHKQLLIYAKSVKFRIFVKLFPKKNTATQRELHNRPTSPITVNIHFLSLPIYCKLNEIFKLT